MANEMDLANSSPNDESRQSAVAADIAKAYELDRVGDEHGAVRYYDRAWRAGVPKAEWRRFVVGYGSTLRNVGRVDEAVTILSEAHAEDPTYAPFVAFLGLALLSFGKPQGAVATLLGAIIDLGGPEKLDGYQRALGEYQQELLTQMLGRE